ncbi:hypothetical protein ACLOJK_006241 [Asimina triloba]
MDLTNFQVRSVDVKEALRLQNENNFVILDVRPEAEFKEEFALLLRISSPSRDLSSKAKLPWLIVYFQMKFLLLAPPWLTAIGIDILAFLSDFYVWSSIYTLFAAHPPGAINVQIYRLIKEWTAWDIARRAAFAFFGIFSGTEENPEFIQSVESKLDKTSKIIVACSSGGTMRPSQNLPEGQQSRSLIAAYLLVLDGFENVFHLDGGLYMWFKEGLPTNLMRCPIELLSVVTGNEKKFVDSLPLATCKFSEPVFGSPRLPHGLAFTWSGRIPI